MSSPIDISKLNLDSEIPTGPWTMYFHSPEETKWTLNTFINLGAMKTWRDFWSVIEALKADSLSDGMFFLMRDPSPPLWESHHHIRGGCYSFRCQKKDASYIYLNHIIASMLGSLTNDSSNRINGVSISPKRGFNIIKERLRNFIAESPLPTAAQREDAPLNLNIQSSPLKLVKCSIDCFIKSIRLGCSSIFNSYKGKMPNR